jgi:hypothetical protein
MIAGSDVLFDCDAVRGVHPPVCQRSQCTMYGAGRATEPLDAQQNSFSQSAANPDQIGRRRSGVEDDYSRDICKYVCPD